MFVKLKISEASEFRGSVLRVVCDLSFFSVLQYAAWTSQNFFSLNRGFLKSFGSIL